MKLRKDIASRSDIELLVNAFYDKVLADEQLAHIFQDVASVNWASHLPVMYDFFENIILFTGGYEGNPMNLHKHLHHVKPLNAGHFEQWDRLFICTVDELFKGPKAILAKKRAISISSIIRDKILEYHKQADEFK